MTPALVTGSRRSTAIALLALLSSGVPPAASAAEVEVSEGTSFAVATSPDGENLALDLQGRLWILPAAGGQAKAITDGIGDDRLPRFSPDGKQLVFQSFRNGSWHIWIINTNGKGLRALTAGTQDDREPVWVDSQRIVFASDRNRNYDLWELNVGTGALLQLTTDPADDYAPAVSAGGETLAFVSDRGGRPGLYINSSLNNVDSSARLLLDGEGRRMHTPVFSPDGSRLAVVRPEQEIRFPYIAANQLITVDAATGQQTTVSAPDEDVFSFAPAWVDGQTLRYTADGLIKERSLTVSQPRNIAFSASFSVTAPAYERRSPVAAATASQAALGILAPVAAPDGSGVVFTALGDLWWREPNGELEQLTADAFVERDPAFSSDSRYLAFISDRSGSMQIWIRDRTTGADRQVTNSALGMRYPTFSPNAEHLAYQKVGRTGMWDYTAHILDLASGKERRLRQAPGLWPEQMSWSADGRFLTVAALTPFSGRYRPGVNRLIRLDTDDGPAQELLLPPGQFVDFGPVAAPDGSRLALIINGALWIVPVAADGQLAGEPRLIERELADYPSWSRDPDRITYLANDGLVQIDLQDRQRESLPVRLRWSPEIHEHRMFVHAGRLFDGINDGYQTDVDIVVDGNRIVEVAPHRAHPVDDVRVFDASDSVVMPGLIDHHGHHQPHEGEWVGRAWLAFGVTTVVEPGGFPYFAREQREAWSNGARIGPRLFFAGPQLDGARRYFPFAVHITDKRRLEWELERARRLDYSVLKTYTRMPNERQQQLIDAAHKLGIPVTSHEAFPALALGADRVEHLRGNSRLGFSSKQSDLLRSYADVVAIAGAAGATVSPTVVTSGGFFAYVLAHPELANNRQYRSLWPEAKRRGAAGLAMMAGRNPQLLALGVANARQAIFDLHQAGAQIVAGTDSPIFPYGLALIVELANYRAAGLSPFDTLATATSGAAQAMGAAGDLGVIKAGALADMVIVDGDPLADVTDLLNVRAVISNGRYYRLDDLLD